MFARTGRLEVDMMRATRGSTPPMSSAPLVSSDTE
jgi:hypothetical protein